MRVGSLFSGVGGFDLGLEMAGLKVVFQAESDPYRRRVLRRHWPDVPCFNDVCEVGADRSERRGDSAGREPHPRWNWELGGVQLVCGGFPCQDLSVAGRRAGLQGERSGLFFEFARVADALVGPGGWVLIENVPGLLSSHGGRDFAVLLATLAEFGFHDLAWRVLDSRYFGVPQRRRRVYILGRRASGRSACEVLLEPESGGGDFAAGREARKGVAGSVADGARAARSLTGSERWDGETEEFVAHTLRSEGFDAGEDGAGRRNEFDALDRRRGGAGPPADPDGMRAASRLPGRVDDPERSVVDPKPDGPRYAAMGDAVTTFVAEWIGRRLLAQHIKATRGRPHDLA